MKMRHRTILTLPIVAAFLPCEAIAQTPPVRPALNFDCTQIPPPPAEVVAYVSAARAASAAGKAPPVPSKEATGKAAEWQKTVKERDFLQLCKYRAANLALPPATPARVVFMGDSITEGWAGPDSLSDRVNRGISGQTTLQMLGRFQADVIALKPATVHILAGTNDIAGNNGPTDLEMITNNIASMVELAQANGIRVVLGTVPPSRRFNWRPEIDPVPAIAELNNWIRHYGKEKRIDVIDYFAALDDGRSGLSTDDSTDGVHPTPRAYAKMDAVARKALNRKRG